MSGWWQALLIFQLNGWLIDWSTSWKQILKNNIFPLQDWLKIFLFIYSNCTWDTVQHLLPLKVQDFSPTKKTLCCALKYVYLRLTHLWQKNSFSSFHLFGPACNRTGFRTSRSFFNFTSSPLLSMDTRASPCISYILFNSSSSSLINPTTTSYFYK